MRTLIHGGTVETAAGRQRAETGERISALLPRETHQAAAAARLFGLYPPKGNGRGRLEGRALRGAIETVLSRGDVIVERGQFVGAAERGRYVARSRVVNPQP